MSELKEILCSAAIIGVALACTTKAKAVLYSIANRKDDTNVENHNRN